MCCVSLNVQDGALLTASGDGTVRVWDMGTGAIIDVFGHETAGVSSLAVHHGILYCGEPSASSHMSHMCLQPRGTTRCGHGIARHGRAVTAAQMQAVLAV